MEYLFSVFWQEYRVGLVLKEEKSFYFIYDQDGVNNAKKDGFDSIIGFPELNKCYKSNTLFPFFKYRVSSSLRNQKEGILQIDPIEGLLQNEGKLVTDAYQMRKEKRI